MKKLLVGLFVLGSIEAFPHNQEQVYGVVEEPQGNCYSLFPDDLDKAVACALENRDDIRESRENFINATGDLSFFEKGIEYYLRCTTDAYVFPTSGSSGFPTGGLKNQAILATKDWPYQITLVKLNEDEISVTGETLFSPGIHKRRNNRPDFIIRKRGQVLSFRADGRTLYLENSIHNPKTKIPAQVAAISVSDMNLGVMEYVTCEPN